MFVVNFSQLHCTGGPALSKPTISEPQFIGLGNFSHSQRNLTKPHLLKCIVPSSNYPQQTCKMLYFTSQIHTNLSVLNNRGPDGSHKICLPVSCCCQIDNRNLSVYLNVLTVFLSLSISDIQIKCPYLIQEASSNAN